MPNHRMFSNKIVQSAKFLRMPPTSRLLYYDLGMAADDEGVVEAWSVMRMDGTTEDDLRVLVAKDFVKVMNEDLVSYITDWKTNNIIKSDRKHESLYHNLLVSLEPNWNQLGTNLEPEYKTIQVKTIQDNTRQDSIDRKRFTPPTVDDVTQYAMEMGYKMDANSFVDFYSCKDWMVGKNKMKDWKAAVRNWCRRDRQQPSTSSNPFLEMLERGEFDD